MRWFRRMRPQGTPFVMPPQPEPVDADLIDLLNERDGRASVVVLADGNQLTVFNIAWGYDMGEDHAHITTNVSPDVPGQSIDFFRTEDVIRVLSEDGTAVFRRG
jgi:hypothetical protein